jgi:hypothetical protein
MSTMQLPGSPASPASRDEARLAAIDAVLVRARDYATAVTRQIATMDARSGWPLAPRRFGSINDAIFKAAVRQAVQDGQLPPTIQTSATFNQPGRGGIDVWDRMTGVGWDLTTATVREILGHQRRYLRATMRDGTTITEVRILGYTR